MRWLRAYAIHLALFVVGLVVYGAVAGNRLGARSSNPHFALQADAWLRGRVTIDKPIGDDWAKVETVVLDDGSRVQGRELKSRKTFRILGGDEIPSSRIVHHEAEKTVYMSFPPAPAVLMLPQVLVSGRRANDVLFTVVFAAAVLPLLLATRRRLWAAGLSRTNP